MQSPLLTQKAFSASWFLLPIHFKKCPTYIRTFSVGFVKLISSGKSHTRTQEKMGKLHSCEWDCPFHWQQTVRSAWSACKTALKNQTKISFPYLLLQRASSTDSKGPQERFTCYFLGKIYTEQFPGALLKQNNAICSDKKTRREVRDFYVNSILDPKQYYGAAFKRE